jgi:hypothetical protein
MRKRGEVVLALAEVLGIEGITVQGHFARVSGRLAEYRIHLGTGQAYLEVGGQLPEVPCPPGRVEAAVAPLAGMEGTWLREVMMRLAVLSRDDGIEDPDFRRRLRAGG